MFDSPKGAQKTVRGVVGIIGVYDHTSIDFREAHEVGPGLDRFDHDPTAI